MDKFSNEFSLKGFSFERFSMFQACNDRIGYFFMSYDAAKEIADDMPEGIVKGLNDHHDWIEIKDEEE